MGRRHRSEWFQAEFPGFLAPAWIAARILRKRCSIVEHNVEWNEAKLESLLGKTVRLYILVQDADLYGFRFK